MHSFTEAVIRHAWSVGPGRAAIRAIRETRLFGPFLQSWSDYRVPYHSFAEAGSVAATKPVGYERCRSNIYIGDAEGLLPGDYAILFWLQQILPLTSQLFDYGGNIGVTYYAYSPYIQIPPRLRWTVCDIDPFVAEGRRMAQERGIDQLRFSYNFVDGDGSEVFLVSGSLHYIETSMGEQLRQLERPPQHLLINRIPLIDGPETVTLQDIGEALLPCVIRNRKEFVQSIEQAGYRLRDSWNVTEKQCTLPLYPDRSAYWYSGFYFQLES